MRQVNNVQLGFVCVTGDTLISMSDGTKKEIKNIKNGDTVLSFDIKRNQLTTSQVSNYFEVMPERLFKFILVDGREIKCTYDHPILTLSNNKYEYIKAGLLNARDKMIIIDDKEYDKYQEYMHSLEEYGIYTERMYISRYNIKNNIWGIPISSIVEIPIEPVYDFTAECEHHNFIANDIVTHNCVVETPEGQKIGLVKGMSITANPTMTLYSQIPIIKKLLSEKMLSLNSVSQ